MKKASKLYLTLVMVLALGANKIYAQQGFGTDKPNKASVVDLTSATKGLLTPRVALTSTDNFAPISGISAANQHTANSLLVYNTATSGTGTTAVKPGYYYWLKVNASTAGKWVRLATDDQKGNLTVTGGIEFVSGSNGTEKLWADAGIQIANSGVSSDKLANNAVTNTKLADNAVNSAKIENGTVTGSDIAAKTVTAANLDGGAAVQGAVATVGANGVVNYLPLAPASITGKKAITSTAPVKINAGTLVSDAVLADVAITIDNADSTGKSGVVKQAASNPSVNVAADGSLSVNFSQIAGDGLVPNGTGTALNVSANNGISIDTASDKVQLGGSLIKATTITATASNTLAVSGLQTGIASDKVVVADATTGVLKQLKAVMPKFFYMPSIIVPTHSSQFTAINASAGESFTDGTRTGVLNLYERYKAQFGTTGTATQPSSPSAPALPVLPASELHYYVTWYDTVVFQSVSLDAAGKMTYVVKSNADVTVGSFMNIVFAVKEN